MYSSTHQSVMGGEVPSWLVRSSPDQAVGVRALAGDIVIIVFCSWARYSTLTVPLSTQLGETLRCTIILSHPWEGGGSVEILLVASCYIETEDKGRRLDGALGSYADLAIYF